MKQGVVRMVLLGLVVAASACGSDATGPSDPAELEYDPSLGVDLEAMNMTSTGLYWKDLVVGDGVAAAPGDALTVHYTGWLHDGTEFSSSLDGDPFSFVLGVGGVIQGWDQGVEGMGVGGTRMLVIPSELGYGGQAVGDIPRHSTLVFQVQLLSVSSP